VLIEILRKFNKLVDYAKNIYLYQLFITGTSSYRFSLAARVHVYFTKATTSTTVEGK